MTLTEQTVARLREETPSCLRCLHFNNAGAALPPDPVYEAQLEHLALERQIGGYEAAARASEAVQAFYRQMSHLLNCSAREIAWSGSASEAWNTVLQAIPFQPGDRIITGQSEYAGNYLSLLHLCRQKDLVLEVIPNGRDGRIDTDRLAVSMEHGARLMALTHVASQNGTVQPAATVGRMARERGILYLLDAAQSVGQIPLDVEALHCDMLIGTGRKFLRGPRGSGFLYVRNSVTASLQPAHVDLRSARWLKADEYRLHPDARRFESFECPVAGLIALGEAAAYANTLGLSAIHERVTCLASDLREALSSIADVTVHEAIDSASGIVTFHHANIPADTLHQRLLADDINTSVVRTGNTRLDFEGRNLPDLNRASVHYYNTRDEVERFRQAVEAIIQTASDHTPAGLPPGR
ncbi:MAG: aminotransferase class V-fold PLP-dependent enzyme [Pseudomonadota bacterium]